MTKRVFAFLLIIAMNQPCSAQVQPSDVAQGAGPVTTLAPSEVEKIKEENSRLREANSRLELERLKEENSNLKETNSRLEENLKQNQSNAGSDTKARNTRAALRHLGNVLRNTGLGIQNATRYRPYMQTSETTFSNGMTATTTTYPF